MTVNAGDPIRAADVNLLIGEITPITSDGTSVTTETEQASLTVSVVSGVKYELRWCAHVGSGTAGTSALVGVRDTTVAGTLLAVSQVYVPTTSTVGYQVFGINDWTASSTGSQIFKLTLNTNTGTNTVQLRASTARKTKLQLWRIS